ncbi:MAG: hypothetical protein J5J00_06790, partial [Deltaproteobacteria bacterium]|nr:hypothetical protein [Deltaproteobacteria bacterium]
MREKVDIREILLLLSLAAIGLLLRYDFLSASHFVLDSDEAIVGLMAKHILEGAPVPVFYYGQHYMGSFEPLLVAGMFKLVGIGNLGLKAVPLLFSLSLILVIYFLAREIGGRLTARLAALFTAIPPAPLVVWSGKARGGFIEVVVIGAVATLQCCYWLKKPELFRTFLIGFLLGFGWWTNNQIVFFMGPIGFFMLATILTKRDTFLRNCVSAVYHFTAGTAAFILGGLPFWLYNWKHDFVSFGIFGAAERGNALEQFYGVITTALPILLGAKRFWENDEFFPGAALLYSLIFGGMLLLLLLLRRREIASLIVLKIDKERPVELLLLLLVSCCAVFSLSSFGWLNQAPRYLLPAYIAIFTLAAWVIARTARPAPLVAIAATLLILAGNLSSSYLYGRSIPGEPFVYKRERVSRDHGALLEWLQRRNITLVRTNYWIGYRLAFESKENVKFIVFQEPRQVRIKDYEQLADSSQIDLVPLVLVPSQAALVSEALSELGYSFRVEDLSGYKVIYSISYPEKPSRKVLPSEVEVTSNPDGFTPIAGFDGDLATRWGSKGA